MTIRASKLNVYKQLRTDYNKKEIKAYCLD